MLGEIDGLIAPRTTPGGESVFHLYVAKMDTSKFRCTRDEFCKALGAEGVPTAIHYPRPLPKQPALSTWDRGDCPVSDRLSTQVFALPMHHDLTDEQFQIVGESLAKVARAYRN